jgi:Zn finger protein HypA/HybF involved in hydrogenase expression
MMAIAERCATAVGDSDLAWSELKTKPIDVVAALSGASGLGSDIMRAKDYDPAALKRAALVLTNKALTAGKRKKLPMSRAQAHALSVTALFEILHAKCRTCNGASVKIVNQLKMICPTCEGHGVHRYSDREREKLSGIKRGEFHKWASRYQLVIGIAREHDCAPLKAKEKLG